MTGPYGDGNSYAGPQVSAIVALIRGKQPGTYPDLDEWAKEELRESCEHPGYYQNKGGYGKVSLYKALGPGEYRVETAPASSEVAKVWLRTR